MTTSRPRVPCASSYFYPSAGQCTSIVGAAAPPSSRSACPDRSPRPAPAQAFSKVHHVFADCIGDFPRERSAHRHVPRFSASPPSLLYPAAPFSQPGRHSLYGVTCMQAFFYFRTYEHDARRLKMTVCRSGAHPRPLADLDPS